MPHLASFLGLAVEISSRLPHHDYRCPAIGRPAAAAHLSPPFSVQIKKKSVEKAKKEERMSKEFAAMEEAALKAYEEDLKRMQRGSDGNSATFY